MPWVNANQYSPGKRHYVESVNHIPGDTIVKPHGEYRYYTDQCGPSLCGNGIRSNTGYVYFTAEGKKGHSHGGLSVVEQVNLNQRNLCSYCVKKFVHEVRPDLLPAYNIMKTGVVT